jgi:hypothetical protein
MTTDNSAAAEQQQPEMDFDAWLAYGYSRAWCGPAVCETHDGLPTSEAEDLASEDTGEYDCIHILRLYGDVETKLAVEENHSPSMWRASNSGLTD